MTAVDPSDHEAPRPEGPGGWNTGEVPHAPAPPEPPAPPGRRSSTWLVPLVVTVLVIGGGFAVRATEDRFGRDEMVDGLVTRGASRQEAQCIADGAEREFGDITKDFSDAGREEVTEMLRITLECQGATGDTSDCVLDAIVDVIGEDNLRGDPFVDAAEDLTADDRIRLVQLSLRCGGLPAPVARCVTDRMVDEVGRDVFESPQLELTRGQQSRLQKITIDCATRR